MPDHRLCRSADEAVEFADSIGYPVVLRIVSLQIIHKFDVKGVALDLESALNLWHRRTVIEIVLDVQSPPAELEVASRVSATGTNAITLAATGNLTLNAPVMTQGGGVDLDGVEVTSTVTSAPDGTITSAGTITTGGGAVDIEAMGLVNLAAEIDTSGGDAAGGHQAPAVS